MIRLPDSCEHASGYIDRVKRIGAGAALSRSEDPRRAAEDTGREALARSGLDRPSLAVLFATSDLLERDPLFPARVRASARAEHLVGCTGAGVLTLDGEIEEGSGTALLVLGGAGLRARTFEVRNATERKAAPELATEAASAAADASLGLLLVDPRAPAGRLLRSWGAAAPGLPLAGGGAAGNGVIAQFVDDHAVTGAAVGAFFGGAGASVRVAQGCRPIGRPAVVTRASRNRVLELDSAPALEAFVALRSEPLLEDLSAAAPFLAAGLAPPGGPEDHYVVRNLVGLDPAQGALLLSEEVPTGTRFSFVLREAMGAREATGAAASALAADLREGGTPFFGFFIDCASRGTGLYGVQDVDVLQIKRRLGEFPLAGFRSSFELGPIGAAAGLQLYSGVLGVFGVGGKSVAKVG